MSPDELDDLLGALAIDALDPDERELVERHVGTDPRAAAELRELQDARIWLSFWGAPASTELWSRISEATRYEMREEDDDLTDVDDDVVVPITGRRPHLGRLLSIAATLAVVLLAGALIGRGLADNGSELTAADLRDARAVALVAEDDQSSVQLLVLRDGDGYVVGSDLPRLPDDRAYQLWEITNGTPHSAAVLGREVGATKFDTLGSSSTFAITVERPGGARIPHGEPVVSGTLPRSA